jgi:hypothetical protein
MKHSWPKPDMTLPPRDPKTDDKVADLWYALGCPEDLSKALAEYVRRPYLRQTQQA